jgi:hypothetical protein
VKKNELAISSLMALTIMIAISVIFDSISFHLYSFNLLGGQFDVVVIINGVISSFLGIFIAWRYLIKKQYTSNHLTEILLAIITSVLFAVFNLAYAYYGYFELMTRIPLQLIGQVTFGVFLISTITLFIGFLIGGMKLQTMPPPPPPPPPALTGEKPKFSVLSAGKAILVFILIGGVAGYFLGYLAWIILGQIQLAIGLDFPYAALLPPPLIYLVAWIGVGAIVFTFEIIPSMFKG